MLYNDFLGEKISRLGFGTMRLPLDSEGKIDEVKFGQMVDYAMANGVNYFDTAMPYHSGHSELAVGRALAKYPRDSFFLATKFPGHQVADSYDPAGVFEEQLRKCGVEYFDFYLLHNVTENSYGTYTDPKWGILDYFVEQKRLGRIRHLGFSTHGKLDMMKDFLDYAGEHMEFCQIQINYLDWTLQEAKEKYELLTSMNIPVIAMESVRGGKLANLPENAQTRLRALRPDDSDASWGYRWLQQFDNIKVILSGLSDMSQTEDNVRTFTEDKPLSKDENSLLAEIAEELKNSIPCTSCRYCCDGCPMGINIPVIINTINDSRIAHSVNISMFIESLPADKTPMACIGCGKCVKVCPQNINIPQEFKVFSEELRAHPTWAEISRIRNEEAKKLRAGR